MAEHLLNYFTSPEVLAVADEESVNKNALIQSGAVVNDPVLEEMAASKSQDLTMPWNDLIDHAEEPDYMNSDPTVSSTPLEMSGSDARVKVAYQHKSWLLARLVPRLARQSDPAAALASMISGYRTTREQARLLASMKGIIADNIANDAGDMVNDIYSDVVAGSITADMRPSLGAIIDTGLTAGDRRGMFGIMAAHSITIANLEKLDAAGFYMEKDSSGQMPDIKVYRGMVVIEDDAMTVEAGTNSPKYYTYLLGSGAFGYARAPLTDMMKEASIGSDEAAGNGAGVDTYHYRWATCLNPYGIDFTSTVLTPAGKTPNISDLQDATNWDRKVDRKLIQMACLTHN